MKACLVILAFLLLGGAWLSPPAQARGKEVPSRPPTPWKVEDTAMAGQKPAAAPSWRGITPGVSTMMQVIETLGKPEFNTSSQDGILYAWRVKDWDKRNIQTRNSVMIKDGVVSLIQVSDTDFFPTDPQKIKGLYGRPTLTKASYFSDDSQYWAYPLDGRAFLVDSTMQEIPRAVFTLLFAPQSVDQFKAAHPWR